jgi:Holliday junction resolvase-like predicted endonuclease
MTQQHFHPRSLKETIIHVLRQNGPMEIRNLISKVRRIAPKKWIISEQRIFTTLLHNQDDFDIQFPTYSLKKPGPLDKSKLKFCKLGDHPKYRKSALLSLAQGPKDLRTLSQLCVQEGRSSAICPEFWMWCALRSFSQVQQSGYIYIALSKAPRLKLSRTSAKVSASVPIAQRMSEKALETLLVQNLDLLEPGLTLFQRQCRIPIGIVDLLCFDRHRNYVVVEIKRPSADYREVVGQITGYMGWIQKNMASVNQRVRGIIVIGNKNDRLDYSLHLIPDLSVRTFY